jgi:hypothetical protein
MTLRMDLGLAVIQPEPAIRQLHRTRIHTSGFLKSSDIGAGNSDIRKTRCLLRDWSSLRVSD